MSTASNQNSVWWLFGNAAILLYVLIWKIKKRTKKTMDTKSRSKHAIYSKQDRKT